MAIYTKTGDKGETGLYSSDKNKPIRISKDSLRIEAIGSIDEANTFLGVANSFCQDKKLKDKISDIQRNLFKVGSILAGAKLKISSTIVKKMEKEIDKIDKEIPRLINFILPGGDKCASLLFMARAFVRRAERRAVALSKEENVSKEVIIYLNRLSDYVYTLARYQNFLAGQKESVWTSK